MLYSNPYASNNGLHVIDRSCQSITLCWPSPKGDTKTTIIEESDVESLVTDKDRKGASSSQANVSDADDGENAGVTEEFPDWNSDGNWFEIEMSKEQQPTPVWTSVYKGYGWLFKVDGLSPDSVFVFRMKRNSECEWGTEVVGSTDPSPASTEDLNRAVEMNSEYLITRILDLTSPNHLKQILSARDRNGMTTLMVACHTGSVSIAEKLVGAGADVNAQSSHAFRTPLMFATIMGRESVAVLLDTHNASWEIKDKSWCNALDYAINAGNLNIVKLGFKRLGPQFVQRSDVNGWKPLMRAVIISDNVELLKYLLKNGADPNTTDDSNTKSVLMAAILAKKPKFVRFLLRFGANPFYENEQGKSCLKIARGLEFREITELIMKSCEAKTKEEENAPK